MKGFRKGFQGFRRGFQWVSRGFRPSEKGFHFFDLQKVMRFRTFAVTFFPRSFCLYKINSEKRFPKRLVSEYPNFCLELYPARLSRLLPHGLGLRESFWGWSWGNLGPSLGHLGLLYDLLWGGPASSRSSLGAVSNVLVAQGRGI